MNHKKYESSFDHNYNWNYLHSKIIMWTGYFNIIYDPNEDNNMSHTDHTYLFFSFIKMHEEK